ncbi:hypothetical protein AAF712_010620 [Marasmius tenuissimus]|uniref:Uncharacterized protein n=1 Tax=Marasmius tenuissimus TaxID=585030 RepID=A0ABR2ZQ20_9AGAR
MSQFFANATSPRLRGTNNFSGVQGNQVNVTIGVNAPNCTITIQPLSAAVANNTRTGSQQRVVVHENVFDATQPSQNPLVGNNPASTPLAAEVTQDVPLDRRAFGADGDYFQGPFKSFCARILSRLLCVKTDILASLRSRR